MKSENSAIISKQRISSKSWPIRHRNLSLPLTKSTTEDKKILQAHKDKDSGGDKDSHWESCPLDNLKKKKKVELLITTRDEGRKGEAPMKQVKSCSRKGLAGATVSSEPGYRRRLKQVDWLNIYSALEHSIPPAPITRLSKCSSHTLLIPVPICRLLVSLIHNFCHHFKINRPKNFISLFFFVIFLLKLISSLSVLILVNFAIFCY